MNSLLNPDRPPVFCPGCAHDRVLKALDRAFLNLGLAGDRIAMVSDIGCSGLFDTFFNTHAFHGLHGRALTYATGIKMARPDLHVVVTMGDGGMGIGGAHLLSACRRNLDLTLLVLNNFNYGMTGGQCSATTPQDAQVASGFLNRLESPLDICQVTGAAGAGWVNRVSTYAEDLVPQLETAIRFNGFSVLDIWGICPGRYTRANKLTPAEIGEQLKRLPPADAFAVGNARPEYGRAYREAAETLPPAEPPPAIPCRCRAPKAGRQEVVLLGSAGQRIITAGELVCLAGAAAGLNATQKNDYPITVMRGHSVSELILSNDPIGYTGIENPSVVIALAPEGVNRRRSMLEHLPEETWVIRAAGVDLPAGCRRIMDADFRAHGIKPPDWALASLALLACRNQVLNLEMIKTALSSRFDGRSLENALKVLNTVAAEMAG